jgi:Tol biopolymer transport system component
VIARRLLVLLVLCCVAAVPASSATATYPGAAGRIVFTSDRAGSSTSEIYSAAADGADVKRLTWTDGFEQDPAWSPDGSHIAYESSGLNRYRIFVMNQDGTDQHVVSPDTYSGVIDWQPAWSPDGTQIAFASTRPTNAAWHVWIMNADGTNLHQLPGGLTQHPVWSPDGSRIAGDNGNGPLLVVNADGTNERQLTTPPAATYDEAPDWSPDGSSLVFSERSFDGTSSGLYVIGADGSGRRQLTGGAYSDYDPSWSPAGTSVVFRRRAAGNEFFQLYTVGSGGGSATQLLGSGRNDMGPNWGSSTVSPVVAPPQAPRIQIFSPVEGGIYFPGSTDPVFFACTSDISYVMSCVGSQPFGATVDTSFAGVHHLTVTATDVEGRQATATVSYTVLDFTPPVITLRTPADGATYDLGAKVTVDFGCSDDHGSGVVYCGGTMPNGAPLDTSRAGTFTFQVQALDNARNYAAATATYTVVDRTPPQVTITTPADQAVYKQDQVVAADYVCGGSGLLSCIGNVAAGSAIDTSSVGNQTFTVTAEKAGHITTTVSRTYTVIYDFSGFFAPVAATNTWKAGESVPLKFSLHGNRGSDILTAAWSACDGAATATTASGTLSYNATLDRYTFLTATDKAWAGTCRNLTATLRDGTTHRARFTFDK